MSCNCSSGSSYDGGVYEGVCNADIPYPSVSHESVPSLIDNLVYALYGVITKDVTSGKVVWNIPCDPSNIPATINGIPRNDGEGLLCYIVRALNLTTATAGYVTANGVETLTNKTLVSPTITGSGAIAGVFTGNLAGNVTGNVTGNAGTATTLATGRTIALSGDVTGTATSFNGSANISIPVTINAGSVTPSDLSTGGPSWDTSGNVTATSATGARIRAGGAVGAGFELNGPEVRIDIPAANSIAAYTGNIERLRIDNIGNVGIGTSSPSRQLSLQKGSNQIRLDSNAESTGLSVVRSSGATEFSVGTEDAITLSLMTNNVTRLSIDLNGTINTVGNPIINCPTTAKAWAYVTGLVNTNGAAQTFTGNNVASIVRGPTAGLYTITLTSGTFNGSVIVSPISATNNTGSRIVTYSGNMCLVAMYVGATGTDMTFNMVYFSN
jgi:hypothetical protein